MQIHNTLVFWSMVFHTIYFHVLKKQGPSQLPENYKSKKPAKTGNVTLKGVIAMTSKFLSGPCEIPGPQALFFVSMSFIGCLLCFLFFASGLHKHQETVGCSLPDHNYPSWDLKLNLCFRFHSFIAMSGMLLSYQWVKHPTWYSSIFQLTYEH